MDSGRLKGASRRLVEIIYIDLGQPKSVAHGAGCSEPD